jgi:lipopolysaccharide/colanic/teichoic acid biosynthesis glycosyltransferase
VATQTRSSTSFPVRRTHAGPRSGAIPAHALHAPFIARRGAERPAGHFRVQQARSARLPVIDAEVFKAVVLRERKRADRPNRTFGLLLVSAADSGSCIERGTWRAATEALAAAKRETDVLGWLEPEAVLGVVLTEVETFDPVVAEGIVTRVHGAIVKKLGSESASEMSIRLYVHPGQAGGDEGLLPIEPILQRLRSEPRRPVYEGVKRSLDIAGSLFLLAVLLPLLLVLAALVKLTSKGPVFFRQVRIGERAKPFRMLKFRTMRVDVDQTLHKDFVTSFIKSSGQGQKPAADTVFKMTNDPRITRIGHVLRKTSLDELPQLWNVVRGEMSLVGPRPPIPYEVEQYESWHRRRVLEAKPGITGLWQVKGRSRTTFDEMVRLDLRYAKSPSLLTDLKILLATPKAVIAGKGAC